LTLRPAAAMAARRRSFLLPIGRAPRVFDALGRSERTELGLGFGGLGGQPARVSRSLAEQRRRRGRMGREPGSGTVRRRRRARGLVAWPRGWARRCRELFSSSSLPRARRSKQHLKPILAGPAPAHFKSGRSRLLRFLSLSFRGIWYLSGLLGPHLESFSYLFGRD